MTEVAQERTLEVRYPDCILLNEVRYPDCILLNVHRPTALSGYEGPYDINPNAMAGWAALNRMLLERGALDGHYIIPVAPHTRHGMYFKPFILPRWAMHLPDCNDYNGVLHWHNYIMRGTEWRSSGGGGRSIRATNNQLAAMYVRRQRAINTHDLPQRLDPPILALPAAATNPLLPSRLIAVAIAPP